MLIFAEVGNHENPDEVKIICAQAVQDQFRALNTVNSRYSGHARGPHSKNVLDVSLIRITTQLTNAPQGAAA